MKKFFLTTLLLLSIAAAGAAYAQDDVVASGYVHKPMKLHDEGSVEAYCLQKEVLSSRLLCGAESLEGWTHSGLGQIGLSSEHVAQGQHSLRLQSPSMPEKFLGWGIGRGVCVATLSLTGEDWREFNRIRLSVYPSCEGMRSIYMNIGFTNDGEEKIPDVYGREGHHEINLKNNQWNDCVLEFPELPRDKITEVKLWLEIFGRELTQGDSVIVDVDNIVLEKVADPEPAKGWQPGNGRIVLSNTGYTPAAGKKAVMNITPAPKKFDIFDTESGKKVYSGKVVKEKTTTGEFLTADFSDFNAEGRYFLKAGAVQSFPFSIDEDVWDDSVWKVLNFIFCERCGYPVPGKHGTCHSDLHAVYNGNTYPLHGGWHDAGDMAQQTLQSGEISYSLLQMAQRAREKGNIDMYNRLVEEAMWGMDFVLRTRMGDGNRVNAWGTNLWTDGILGTDDDAGRRELDVNDGAYENFMLAGIEAYTALVLEDDPEMTVKLTKAAREDYAFARARYDKYGFQELQMIRRGHAKNTPESQYNASVSWAASVLFSLTGDKYYADEAVRFIELPLKCQCTEPVGGIKGFFYGDEQKHSGVHFSHKSRDYAFMEALEILCRTQPNHPDKAKWVASAKMYGDYLKSVMKYVEPYGMAPSGVYNAHEIDYPELFFPWQLGAKRETAAEVYAAQLASGEKLDEENYLRRFPVWYSFRGNTVVSLSTGKAAAICARITGDAELKDIAEKQLAWVVGANPFGQSIIYGEGAFWGQQYNALPGEMTGEIPVGFQSRGNEDEPYWPQFNNATYKEVFGLTASRWMMLVSEF